MFSHTEFRDLVQVTLPDLTPGESMALRAVALHETSYGSGWGNPAHTAEPEKARVSKNLGAITMRPSSRNPDGTVVCVGGFRHGDSLFNESTGKVERYETCFRSYATWESAIEHLAKVLLKDNVRAAANAGDLRGVATAMRDNNYYLGIAPTRKGQIDAYHHALTHAVERIVEGTGEADPFLETGGSDSSAPLSSDFPPSLSSLLPSGGRVNAERELSMGSRGELVGVWQAYLNSQRGTNLVVDGIFGPITQAATIKHTDSTRVGELHWQAVRRAMAAAPSIIPK